MIRPQSHKNAADKAVRLEWYSSVFLISLWFLCLVGGVAQAAKPSDTELTTGRPAVILIVNSYNQGYAWTDEQTQGILETLGKRGYEVEPWVEYLDWKRVSDPIQLAKSQAYIQEKYQGRVPAVIITCDDIALFTGLQLRKAWGHDIPIVFSGVTKENADALLRGERDVTGIYETTDVAGTVDIVRRLRPDPVKLYFISDSTETGKGFRRDVGDALSKAGYAKVIEFMENKPIDRIREELAHADPKSIALLVAYNIPQGEGGQDARLLARELSAQSAVPIVVMHDHLRDTGVLGGSMINGVAHGNHAAALALRVFDGASASSLPIESSLLISQTFDFQALKRYSIDDAALPPESIVTGKPVSFYEQHRGLVVGIVLVFVLMASVMVLLIVNMRLRQRMAAQWKDQAELMEKKVRERTEELDRARIKLQRSERVSALSKIVVGISHQLNTPLGNILSVNSFLSSQINEHGVSMSIDLLSEGLAIQRSALDKAISLLARYSQIDAAREMHVKLLFHVKPFLEDLITALKMKPELMGLDIILTCPDDLQMDGFPGLLRQVLIDLLDNVALHAYEKSIGVVRIRVEAWNGKVTLFIEDKGKGIPAGILPRVFEPFFTTGIQKGTGGLGLSISAATVSDIMGGTLALESVEGSCTVASIALPQFLPDGN